MATITMRELLRDAKTVFDQMEADNAPVLITRNGLPVAALVPVDPDHAEAITLAASAELIEDRNRALNAHAEGRTKPLEDLLGGDADEEQSFEAFTAGPGAPTVVAGDTLFNIAKKYLDEDRIGDLVLAVAASVDQIAHGRAHEIAVSKLQSSELQSQHALSAADTAEQSDAAVRNAAFRLGEPPGPEAVGGR